jgi:7-cyano-7-deazaguanine synthase in queuosine biosynthesis
VKSHIVMWSGGCDSTLVLYNLATEYGTKNNPIDAVTIKHSQVMAYKEQRRARQLLMREFKSQGLHIRLTEVELNYKGKIYCSGTGIQAMSWLFLGLSLAPDFISSGEKTGLYTGHISEDSMWCSYEGLYRVFEDLSRMMRKEVEWVLPVANETKASVITSLKKNGLLKHCWYCERPKESKVGSEPCGDCKPCRMHQTALYQIRKWGYKKGSILERGVK